MENSLLSQGNLAFRNKEYETAIQRYTAAICENPELESILATNLHLAKRRSRQMPIIKEMTAAYAVDVVVPVYNALDDVKQCLKSLVRCRDKADLQIIVVNDGSDEQTTKWLREYCAQEPIFQLIDHSHNRGYTIAINAGLKASTAPFVITLNSDTIVTHGWISRLVRCINSADRLGIVGPLSNAASWQSVPSLYDKKGEFAINDLPIGMTPDDMATIVAKASVKAYPRSSFLNGFCYMIRREVLDKIGFMDEENFPIGYGEENDFCIRAADAGYEFAIADDAYVFHSKSKSFGHERRNQLSKTGSDSLKKKYGSDKYTSLLNVAKHNSEIMGVRKRINDLLLTIDLSASKPEIHTSISRYAYVDSVDMHGTPIRLYPIPAFARAGYQLEPTLDAPCVLLPYANKSDSHVRQSDSSLNIAVHLHLFYEELLDEFIYFLQNIKQQYTLYVSLAHGAKRDIIRSILVQRLPNANVVVETFQNKGRDIAPLLAGFGSRLRKHDLILHIHSKRSLHNPEKADWRRQLLVNLLGSAFIVEMIIELFEQNKRLGLLFPEYHYSLKGQISWGTNYPICHQLAQRLGLNISEAELALFAAGSMFWARMDALRPLLDLNLSWNDFQDEMGQVDGTIAHAVERLLGEIVSSQKYEMLQCKSEKPHDLIRYYPHKWKFEYSRSNKEINKDIAVYAENRRCRRAKAAIYTALTGGYDQPVVHEQFANECDYIMFTDTPLQDRGFWEIRPFEHANRSLVKRARHIKVNPHKYLNEYDIAIWIDANVIICCDISKYIDIMRNNTQVALLGIKHPHRSCIYEEGQAVIAAKKDNSECVMAQMNRYRSEGFPNKFGLIETNLLIINLRHPDTTKLFEAWSSEIERGSHRDQLSLNYCIWKTGAKWNPIFNEKITLRSSFDFAYLGHGKNSGYPPNVDIQGSRLIDPNLL